MELNRTLVLGLDSSIWIRGKFCERMLTLDNCYFLPMSSCRLRDVSTLYEERYDHNRNQQGVPVLTFKGDLSFHPYGHQHVPSIFNDLLSLSSIPRHKWFYWWRSQSAAYIFRLNGR